MSSDNGMDSVLGALVGKVLPFYGVDPNRFKLGEVVYEAVEDPDNGYRSYLGSVEVTDGKGIFSSNPLAQVTVREIQTEDGWFEGWELVDAHVHVWLQVGTNHADSHYPFFVFAFTPEEGAPA